MEEAKIILLLEQAKEDREYLIKQMFKITAAESPMDMYDIAVESLKKFGLREAMFDENN